MHHAFHKGTLGHLYLQVDSPGIISGLHDDAYGPGLLCEAALLRPLAYQGSATEI